MAGLSNPRRRNNPGIRWRDCFNGSLAVLLIVVILFNQKALNGMNTKDAVKTTEKDVSSAPQSGSLRQPTATEQANEEDAVTEQDNEEDLQSPTYAPTQDDEEDAVTEQVNEEDLQSPTYAPTRDEQPPDTSDTKDDQDTGDDAKVFSGWTSKIKYDFFAGEKIFLGTALSLEPTTDKVVYGHHYDIMYGQFLMPFYASKPNMKFLEIGLGCDMFYGAGASVAVWKALFPEAELWEAEFDAPCVEKSKGEGKLDGFGTLTGDQMDIATLDSWIEQTKGGDFDIVIDDGGHKQCMIWTSFLKLWPKLKSGGIYFIEDLQVSRESDYSDASSPICHETTNVPDQLMAIMDALIHRKSEEIGYKDLKFMFCQRDSCALGKHYDEDLVEPNMHSTIHENNSVAQKIFLEAAFAEEPQTDKVKWGHHYDIMYGQFLMPFYVAKPKMKFLEIGLGCDMFYGPGASVKIWQKLFPEAEMWEAEYDAACVEKSKQEGKMDGINTLTGDQMDLDTLDKWIEQTGGGDFDVVVDDGGHKQCHIWTTFEKLWPLLKPGGLYFIEDLQVSRDPEYNDVSSSLCPSGTNVPDELKKIVDAMIHRKEAEIGYEDVKFVFCQRDSCVLGKHPPPAER